MFPYLDSPLYTMATLCSFVPADNLKMSFRRPIRNDERSVCKLRCSKDVGRCRVKSKEDNDSKDETSYQRFETLHLWQTHNFKARKNVPTAYATATRGRSRVRSRVKSRNIPLKVEIFLSKVNFFSH